MRENTKFVIIDVKDIDFIDFNTVKQTGPHTMRYSIDRSKTFVKYDGEQPECLFSIAGDLIGLHEYTHEEFLDVLKGPEWRNQD